MTDQEMIQLLNDIMETQLKVDTLRGRPKGQLELRAPAQDAEISVLRSFLLRKSLQLPLSYEQFLRISNGVSNFRCVERLNLRSISEIVSNEQADEGWDYIGPCWQFVIGSGDITNVIAFDPDSLNSDNEMTIAEFYNGEDYFSENTFENFLVSELTALREDLVDEIANRANLADD